ncbi:MAG TPA: hypothetical protein VFZ91_10220 [Allosphingosinicella sp.]
MNATAVEAVAAPAAVRPSQGRMAAYLEEVDAWRPEPRNVDDLAVWQDHLDSLIALQSAHPDALLDDFREGFADLRFARDTIPSLDDLNLFLAPYGWRAAHVIGMVPDDLYQEMLAARIFPVARHFRSRNTLDHVPVPDFLHDVFGHIPLLACPDYRALIAEWAEAAVDHHDGPSRAGPPGGLSPQALFGRFYTWAIEFGILAGNGSGCRILGAAILSSPGEWSHYASGAPALRSFDDGAMASGIDYEILQPTLFTVRDIGDYRVELDKLRTQLRKE